LIATSADVVIPAGNADASEAQSSSEADSSDPCQRIKVPPAQDLLELRKGQLMRFYYGIHCQLWLWSRSFGQIPLLAILNQLTELVF
jgi:hypothetical protein